MCGTPSAQRRSRHACNSGSDIVLVREVDSVGSRRPFFRRPCLRRAIAIVDPLAARGSLYVQSANRCSIAHSTGGMLLAHVGSRDMVRGVRAGELRARALGHVGQHIGTQASSSRSVRRDASSGVGARTGWRRSRTHPFDAAWSRSTSSRSGPARSRSKTREAEELSRRQVGPRRLTRRSTGSAAAADRRGPPDITR